MKVIDFSKYLGIPATKIRYYDKIGLIQGERNEKNNYRDFTKLDGLKIYQAKMLRSFGMSIDQCMVSKEKQLEEINDWTNQYIIDLEKEIAYKRIMQERLKEMQIYYRLINDKLCQFAPLDLDEQYIVWNIGDDLTLDDKQCESIRILSDHMPFSFIAIKIKKESLFDCNEFLKVEMGLGILKHNAEKLGLQLSSYLKYPGQPTIQYVFETVDPFRLSKKQIQPLLDYIQENHLVAEDIVGRIVLNYKHGQTETYGILLSVQLVHPVEIIKL